MKLLFLACGALWLDVIRRFSIAHPTPFRPIMRAYALVSLICVTPDLYHKIKEVTRALRAKRIHDWHEESSAQTYDNSRANLPLLGLSAELRQGIHIDTHIPVVTRRIALRNEEPPARLPSHEN
jgi:hypothetical protein